MELSAAEARVLGCLIEKAATAPDAYPVTLNDLRLACNQTSRRHPVVAYDDRTVEDTLLALKSKGLARSVPPARGERAPRYAHRADQRWRMGPAELAVLSVLLVGGPLPPAEIEARAWRLHDFADVDEVEEVLDTLAARMPTPFAVRLGGRSGSRLRWAEALTGEYDAEAAAEADDRGREAATSPSQAVVVADQVVPGSSGPSYGELAARVDELERRLAAAMERPAGRGAGRQEWRAGRAVPLRDAGDERYASGRWSEPVARAERDRGLPAPAEVVSTATLAERLADIERRLARIEAELGALR